jgi:DNA-binding response OmpR family regulator
VSTVLVAEDDPDISLLLRAVMTSLGHEAVLCRTGADVLAQAPGVRPDLLVLDVNLPGDLDGLGVARALREAGSTTPVLMLTARASAQDRDAGLAAGADDYLAKPFDLDELISRVNRLLAG